MNEAKCQPEDYIQFLLASPGRFRCVEAAQVQPGGPDTVAHDAFRRLLLRLQPDAGTLWQEVRGQIPRDAEGLLVLDNTVLDKPYAQQMGLVGGHFSGKHNKVVRGITLLTWLWTDGDRHLPCDYRLYDKKADGCTKNGHFRQMLRAAAARGLRPRCVCFDSWYASLDNLKQIRALGWTFLTRLKYNRRVRVGRGPVQLLHQADLSAQGTQVWLPGFGLVRVFRIVAQDGDTEYWASNDLGMGELERLRWADSSWRIEEYHRGLKQHCGVERCQARRVRAQRKHLGLSIRAFLRLEVNCFRRGWTWLQAKMQIVRRAVAAYLHDPILLLSEGA